MATSTATLLPTTQNYYTKKALDFLKPRVVFLQHCQVAQALPSNSGRTVTFYRNTKLAAATTPLTEGVTPAGSNIARVAYTTTPSQYGDFTVITDIAAQTDINSQVVESIREVVAEQAARTVDIIVRSEIVNFSQVVNAGRVADGAFGASSTLKADDLRRAAAELRGNDVLPYENGRYVAIIHPSAAYQLQSETGTGGFMDLKKYDDSKVLSEGPRLNGYMGSINGVDVYESSLVDTTVIGPFTAYRNVVMGKNAFACVQMDKNSLAVITKSFESGGTEDPLEQRMTLGWKSYLAAKSIDDTAAGGKNIRSIVVRSYAS
jgi:N4-gp56 family major capsid protein